MQRDARRCGRGFTFFGVGVISAADILGGEEGVGCFKAGQGQRQFECKGRNANSDLPFLLDNIPLGFQQSSHS